MPPIKAKFITNIFRDQVFAITLDDTVVGWGRSDSKLIKGIPPGLKAKFISKIYEDVVFAITLDDSVVGWGDPTDPLLTDMPPGLKAKSIALSNNVAFTIALDDTIQKWGKFGQYNFLVQKMPRTLLKAKFIAVQVNDNIGYAITLEDILVVWNSRELQQQLPQGLKVKSIGYGVGGILAIMPDDTIKAIATSPDISEIPERQEPYKGYTKSSIDTFINIFERPLDFSFCPICLEYIDRSAGCMYMTHTCKKSQRHEKLYQLYKDTTPGPVYFGKIEWCTLCGRLTHQHKHFKNPDVANLTKLPGFAPLAPGAAAVGDILFFDKDCVKSGGGGFEEKIKRYHAFVYSVCAFQKEVDKLSDQQIRNRIAENCLRAFSLPDDGRIAKAIADKKIIIPPDCELSEDSKIAPKEEEYPDVVRPADEAAFAPISHPQDDTTNACMVSASGGDEPGGNPVWEFQHVNMPKTNPPTLNTFHQQKICAEDLVSSLKAEVFTGKCPKFLSNNRCQAWLYPEELKAILGDADPYNEVYRKLFNQKYAEAAAGPVAGGGRRNLFSFFGKIDDAQCSLIPEKKAGKRRTFRKRIKLRKTNKRRRSFRTK
jgi:hypothetical protein